MAAWLVKWTRSFVRGGKIPPYQWHHDECPSFPTAGIFHTMRILHTMLRVGDLQRSIAFYTEVLGMKLLRQHDYPEGRFTLAFVGYTDESEGAVIELTYNWGVESYDLGSAYGHIALGVDNVAQTCEDIRKAGGNVTREAGPVKGGSTIIAFVEDPDGYTIALIESKHAGQGLGH